MKKFVMGVIIGALLTIGVSAAADSIGKIGKQITNEYVVKVNGSALDATAIAVDGTSYAPVRAIAGAAGFEVDFKNGEVLLVSGSSDVSGLVRPISDIEASISIGRKSVQNGEELLNQYKAAIGLTDEEMLADPVHALYINASVDALNKDKARLAELEAELEARLAE